MFAESASITALVNLIWKPSKFRRYPIIWGIINIEFVSCFGVSFVNVIRDVNTYFSSSTLAPIILGLCLFCEANFNVFGVLLEDIICGDLGITDTYFSPSFFLNNMDTYLSPFIHCVNLSVIFGLYGLPDFEGTMSNPQLLTYSKIIFLLVTFIHGGVMLLYVLLNIVSQKKDQN